MKVLTEELIEQVQDELLCYEEGEALVDIWKKEFLMWLTKNKGHHKDIVETKQGLAIKVSDEGDIFEMADAYLEAVEEQTKKEYWAKF
ncbi:MAG: hypothetical protein R3Y53_11460 [Bacillota bacterium]